MSHSSYVNYGPFGDWIVFVGDHNWTHMGAMWTIDNEGRLLMQDVDGRNVAAYKEWSYIRRKVA